MAIVHNVYPSENAVGSWSGSSPRLMREFQHALAWKYLGGSVTTRVISGLAVADGGGLSVTVANGVALVNGFFLELTGGPETQSGLTGGATNYIWLSLQKSGGLVTGWQITTQVNTVTPPSSDSVFLAKVTTLSSSVNVITNVLPFGGGLPLIGTYAGSGLNDREFYVGFQPRFIRILGVAGVVAESESGLTSGSGASGFYRLVNTGTNAWSTVKTSTSRAERPEIFSLGFIVSTAISGDLNHSGASYRFWVW